MLSQRGGKRLVWEIADILREHHYTEIDRNRFRSIQNPDRGFFATEVGGGFGHGVFGAERRVDIAVYHPRLWRDFLVIECKYQRRHGSMEEKIVPAVEALVKAPHQSILVMDGGGYSPRCIQWVKDQVGRGKFRDVMSRDDFANKAGKKGWLFDGLEKLGLEQDSMRL